jgi:uncharacterized protein (DUF1800 family)
VPGGRAILRLRGAMLMLQIVALRFVTIGQRFLSSSAKAEAALALHRFGMGPRPGSIEKIASDPRGALLAELDNPPP